MWLARMHSYTHSSLEAAQYNHSLTSTGAAGVELAAFQSQAHFSNLWQLLQLYSLHLISVQTLQRISHIFFNEMRNVFFLTKDLLLLTICKESCLPQNNKRFCWLPIKARVSKIHWNGRYILWMGLIMQHNTGGDFFVIFDLVITCQTFSNMTAEMFGVFFRRW